MMYTKYNKVSDMVGKRGIMYHHKIYAAVLFFALFMLSVASAQDGSILATIDAQVSYDSDFSAEYTIIQHKPGQGASTTRVAMFRRDADDKYLALILDPVVDRGKGYLKIGNNLWLYDPVDRRFNVTSARDRFQNSNLRNSDFTRSTLAQDYTIVRETREQLGVYNTRVYDLEARHSNVTYSRMKIWVDTNNLVRKVEDYSVSGQLLRTTAIPRYQTVADRYIPVQIVVIDALSGGQVGGKFQNERTVMTVAKPNLNDLPDLVFTQAYLERVSQ